MGYRGRNLNTYLVFTVTCANQSMCSSLFYRSQQSWYLFTDPRRREDLVGLRRSVRDCWRLLCVSPCSQSHLVREKLGIISLIVVPSIAEALLVEFDEHGHYEMKYEWIDGKESMSRFRTSQGDKRAFSRPRPPIKPIRLDCSLCALLRGGDMACVDTASKSLRTTHRAHNRQTVHQA